MHGIRSIFQQEKYFSGSSKKKRIRLTSRTPFHAYKWALWILAGRGYLNKGPAKANSTHPVKVSDLSNAKSTAPFHSALRQRLGVWELTHKARLLFSCFPPRKPACQLQTLAWAQPSVNTVWQHNIGPPLVCLWIWALQQKTIPSTDLTSPRNSSVCAW